MTIKHISISLLLMTLASVAAPALAETGTTTTTTPPAMEKKVDGACMQAAVEKRDSAMIAAVDAYYTAVKAALQARKDALRAAWGIADPKARRGASEAAWKTFKSGHKKVTSDLKKARRATWKQFGTDRKACHATGSEDSGSEGIDAQI